MGGFGTDWLFMAVVLVSGILLGTIAGQALFQWLG